MARKKTERGYAQDIRRAQRGQKRAWTLARRLGYDADWMRRIRDIVAESERATFASRGSAVGIAWKKPNRTYVHSGELKNELVHPGQLRARVQVKTVMFAAFTPQFKRWGNYVTGFTNKARVDITDWTGAYLAELANDPNDKRGGAL